MGRFPKSRAQTSLEKMQSSLGWMSEMSEISGMSSRQDNRERSLLAPPGQSMSKVCSRWASWKQPSRGQEGHRWQSKTWVCRGGQGCREAMCRPTERVETGETGTACGAGEELGHWWRQVGFWAVSMSSTGQKDQARLDQARTARLLKKCIPWAHDREEIYPVSSLTQHARAGNSMRTPSSCNHNPLPIPLPKMSNIVLTVNERCLKDICPVSKSIYWRINVGLGGNKSVTVTGALCLSLSFIQSCTDAPSTILSNFCIGAWLLQNYFLMMSEFIALLK